VFERGRSKRVRPDLVARIGRRLDALDAAQALAELNVPGFDLHALRGFSPVRYTIHVNGPWCITFEWHDGHAERVDLEQYH
jgi:proteic killer suppression protein